MTTRIRLTRRGTTKRPYYHIVVAHKTAPRDGKFVERIGLYDPKLTENKTTLDKERVEHWLKVGARPTERVVKLFKLQGIEVPATLMDKQAPSAGKQKALTARAAERQKVQEAKAQEEAARAKKKQAAEPAAGGEAAPAEA